MKYLFRMAVCASFLLGVASCNIKESRMPCPCYLNLNVDEMVRSAEYDKALVTVMTDKVLYQSVIRLDEYDGRGVDVEVPRRIINASVATGHDNLWWKSDTLYAATNLEWGPVWVAREQIECNDDEVHRIMEFHKEYCRVNFFLVGVTDVETYPYDIRLKANCNAIRMRDGKPLRGKYTAYASPYNTAMCSVLVPRQDESEMIVDLLWHDDMHEYSVDDYVFTMDLGKLMRAQGYNWEKRDLDDINVNIDLVKATASISIRGWDSQGIEVEI